MGRITNKRVLVTGGTGFVGSHVVEALVKLGAEVVVTYRGYNAQSYFFSRNLQYNTHLVIVDLKDKERVIDVISKYQIEYIVHLAAQPLVTVAYNNPAETLSTNIMGTVHILESARLLRHVKGIIVASSDKAYGKSESPYKEIFPLAGDHPYDVSKSAADLITTTYTTTYDVPTVITRFGNIYGEGDLNMSRIVPGVMHSLISGIPLELRSDGSFVRDYLYVKDVALGYLAILEQFDNVRGEAFNFGTNYSVSVLNLIRDLESILGQKIDYQIKNNSNNEIHNQHLLWNKANHLLGWKPNFKLEDTAQSVFEWYRSYFKNAQDICRQTDNLKQLQRKSGTIFLG